MKKPTLIALLSFVLSSSSAFSQGVWIEENFGADGKTGKIVINQQIFDIMPNANLKAANLEGADLRGVNLMNSDLSNARLKSCILDEANMREVNLNTAYMVEASMKRTDLRKADLGGATLAGADLGGADLTDADLNGIQVINLEGMSRSQREAALENMVSFNGTQWNTQTSLELEVERLNQQIEALKKERDDAIQSSLTSVEQLQDARAGSVVFEAGSNSNAVIMNFEIEESDDLKTWVKSGNTVTKRIVLDNNKKFYRFALDK